MKCLRYCLPLLLLLALELQAKPRVEIFELKNRPAETVIDQLKALYPEEGTTFSQDGPRLMVKAEDQVISEISALVKRLDVAPAQMRITLRRQQTGNNSREGNTHRLSTRSSNSEQSIVVQDGEMARIESGTIRQVTRALQSGDSLALISEETPMTKGFLVQPRAIGPGQVELRVMSFNDAPDRHSARDGDVETAAVVTMRRATPGEWVPLGSVDESRSSSRSTHTYSTANTSTSSQYWSIKVDMVQ